MGKVVSTHLDWHKDFGGHGEVGKNLTSLLEANLHSNQGSVLFFAGEPGVGKTTSAAALVAELAQKTGRPLELRLVGEQMHTANAVSRTQKDNGEGDDNDDKLDAHNRLAQILVAKALARQNPNIVLLVEEPDSVLSKKDEKKQNPVERVAGQRLLEDKTGILIFTGNHWDFHPAVKQRIDFQMQFHTLGAKERASILTGLCERFGITIPAEELTRIATTYNLPNRLMEQAVDSTSRVWKQDEKTDFVRTLEFWIQLRAKNIFDGVQEVFDGNPTANMLFDTRFLNISTTEPSTNAADLITALAATRLIRYRNQRHLHG